MSDNLGDLPGANPLAGVQLTGNMTKIDLPDGQSIEVDSAIAALVKSVEIELVVTRADGTVEAPIVHKTEFRPAA